MIIQGYRFKIIDGKKVYDSPFQLNEEQLYSCTDCGENMLVTITMPEFLSWFKDQVTKFQCMDCAERELNSNFNQRSKPIEVTTYFIRPEVWKGLSNRCASGDYKTHGDNGGRKAISLISPNVKTLLDVGAGNCFWSTEISRKGIFVYALDYFNNPEVVKDLQPNDKLKMIKGDAHNIPLQDKSVDAVFCSHTFEHLLAPFVALYEFNRVLKLDGELIILTPWDTESWHFEASHINVSPPHKIIHQAGKLGFKLLERIDDAGESSYILKFKKEKEADLNFKPNC